MHPVLTPTSSLWWWARWWRIDRRRLRTPTSSTWPVIVLKAFFRDFSLGSPFNTFSLVLVEWWRTITLLIAWFLIESRRELIGGMKKGRWNGITNAMKNDAISSELISANFSRQLTNINLVSLSPLPPRKRILFVPSLQPLDNYSTTDRTNVNSTEPQPWKKTSSYGSCSHCFGSN